MVDFGRSITVAGAYEHHEAAHLTSICKFIWCWIIIWLVASTYTVSLWFTQWFTPSRQTDIEVFTHTPIKQLLDCILLKLSVAHNYTWMSSWATGFYSLSVGEFEVIWASMWHIDFIHKHNTCSLNTFLWGCPHHWTVLYILHMLDWCYQYEVLECTSCFVCCIAGARFYDVDRGHRPPALLQLMWGLHMLAQLQWCTQICQVGYIMSFMIFFINRNTSDQEKDDGVPHTQSIDEHFRPRKGWRSTSYSIYRCKILCVYGVRPWANRHSLRLIKRTLVWKNESNNVTKITHMCMLAGISTCSARLVASC